MISYPIDVGGTRTRIVEHGSGPAVVLIHGLGTRADRWRTTMERLADSGRRVIAFDLPGHGFAAKGEGIDYSVQGYARFLAALLDTLGLERPVLIGASLGGQVAATFAARTPQRAAALILVGSTGLKPFGPEARLQTSRMLVDMSKDAIRTRLQRGLRNHALITDELVEEDFRINNSPGAAEAFRALGAYFAERIDDDVVFDALKSLDGKVPLMLVWGPEDAAVPIAVAEEVAGKLKFASFVTLPGTAHNPYMDKPAEFCRAVMGFLSKASVPAG